MALFEYRCPIGHTRLAQHREDAVLCGSDCSEIARRHFSFNISAGIQSHYNNAVGKYVNNEREFRDELKRAADRQSEAMGYSATYDYVDPGDIRSKAKITDEGLDVTYKRARDNHLMLKDGDYVPT